ncbi:hypothetical protein [Legionella tunisiensis]|uniref:hypothetical protein n=1 Tax=Legionella tunisiensis TaxID=1034944 RepID=UPI00037DD31E|nr:hypothetical protein [Legionella tunisiensis]
MTPIVFPTHPVENVALLQYNLFCFHYADLGDSETIGHAKVGHFVEHATTYHKFLLLIWHFPGIHFSAQNPLISLYGKFGVIALAIASCPLPCHSTIHFNFSSPKITYGINKLFFRIY